MKRRFTTLRGQVLQSREGRQMTTGYSRLRIRLHWLTVGLLAIQWLCSDSMPAIINALDSGAAPDGWQFLISSIHVYSGLAVLGVVIVRLYLRLRDGAPPPPTDLSGFLVSVGLATHFGLYIALIMMPVSGALSWFGVVDDASIWHHRLGWVLLLLITVHVLAALWHHWVKKDGVLHRMLKSAEESDE